MTLPRLFALVSAWALPAAVWATGSSGVTPIAPGGGIVSSFAGGSGVGGYLRSAHMAAVVAVAAIAVVMIIWGAVLLFGESVWGKTQGKAKIWNAVWGLLLAAGSYVILGTVSQSLLSSDFALDPNLGTEATSAGQDGSGTGSSGGSSSGAGTNNSPGTSSNILDGFKTQSGTAAEAIAEAARYAADNKVGTCQYTAGGRTSCAYAVDDIIEAATGYSVTSSGLVKDLQLALEKNPNFDQISGGFAATQPGDIIVSPNGSLRHTGIVTQAGGAQIVSNSSDAGGVRYNRGDGADWSNYYGANNVFIFRPTGSVNSD